MNPLLETLLVPDDATWNYFYRRLPDDLPFNWHYHDEYELTLTTNSVGQRYVGDNIETYGDGDLVLLGSNLPHTWMSMDKVDPAEPHLAHVFWIRAGWMHTLVDTLRELERFQPMLALASRGILYSPKTADLVRARVDDLRLLAPSARIVRFIEVLTILGEATDYRLLSAPRAQAEPASAADQTRVEKTLEYIHQHYEKDIALTTLAELASLSVSGLHRAFKRHTRMTVGEYIAQLRVGKACALLVSTDRPVSSVAYNVGYANLSHFNRQFLALKGATPREFRRAFHAKQSTPSPSPLIAADESTMPVHFSLAQASRRH